MKGKNLTKVPGELYAPTPNGVVVSADGVKDYKQNKTQEAVNQNLIDMSKETREIASKAAGSAASIANIVKVLEEHGEDNIADVLKIEDRVQDNEAAIEKFKEQLADYNIVEKSEAEMEAIIENDEADNDTIYLVPEEEDE